MMIHIHAVIRAVLIIEISEKTYHEGSLAECISHQIVSAARFRSTASSGGEQAAPLYDRPRRDRLCSRWGQCA
jgi:hypothetical protein